MKVLTEEGNELVDGTVVSLYEGRFTGFFEMDMEEGAPITKGDVYTFLVTARCGPPSFKENIKSGEMKRINSWKLQEVHAMDPDAAGVLLDSMGVSVFGVNEGLVEVSKAMPEPEPEPDLGFDPESLKIQ